MGTDLEDDAGTQLPAENEAASWDGGRGSARGQAATSRLPEAVCRQGQAAQPGKPPPTASAKRGPAGATASRRDPELVLLEFFSFS